MKKLIALILLTSITANATVVEVVDENIDYELGKALKTKKAIVLEAYDTECDFCKQMRDDVLSLSDGYKNIEFFKFDVGYNRSIKLKYIPTFFYCKKDMVCKQKIGHLNKKELKEWIEEGL